MRVCVELVQWLRGLFSKRPTDWDAFEVNLVKQGWSPDQAHIERLEEEFSPENLALRGGK